MGVGQSACFDRVKPLVDETVRRLAVKAFRDDPIAGKHYARVTSIVSSAYKRHGKILEAAICERLRDNNRLSVWSDPSFPFRPQPTDLCTRALARTALPRSFPTARPLEPFKSTSLYMTT